MLRLLLTPRWVGWTLLAATAAVGCGAMSWWQVLRAESAAGSLLNAGYAFQWPLFGLFFLALWWRMLRAESRELDAVVTGARTVPDAAAPADVRADPRTALVGGAGPSPFTPRPRGTPAGQGQGQPRPGSARAEVNAHYADLARRGGSAPLFGAGLPAAPPTPSPSTPSPPTPEQRP